jgi:hypothetical protein
VLVAERLAELGVATTYGMHELGSPDRLAARVLAASR